MEKRLTTIHGHTTSAAFDPERGGFFAKDVTSDFAPLLSLPSKPCTTVNVSPPKARRRADNTFGRFERDADGPPDHPRLV
jgi:hypothetical protein